MQKPTFDRDSLYFSRARHLEDGIEVVAEFQAPKVSNPDEGPQYYLVTLTIDPATKVAHSGIWELENRSYSGPKDKLRELEKQLRDHFIKTTAWDILSKRKPDPNYAVDELGTDIVLPSPIRRRI